MNKGPVNKNLLQGLKNCVVAILKLKMRVKKEKEDELITGRNI